MDAIPDDHPIKRPVIKAIQIRRRRGHPFMTDADRFWSKVDKRGPEECWPWTGSIRAQGYGQFHIVENGNRKSKVASRFSYILANGPIEGGDVMHSCDNPRCVNPNHLSLGTRKENVEDCIRKGRHNPKGVTGRSHCRNGHLYTAENTGTKSGHRFCLDCAAIATAFRIEDALVRESKIMDLITDAVATEREACAKMTEDRAKQLTERANRHFEEGDQGSAIIERGAAQEARVNAAAIRARGETR